MTKAHILTALLPLFFCSCGIHPQEVIYQIEEPYPAVKGKLTRYYEDQKRSFSLFQDEITYRQKEVAAGQKCTYTLLQTAPDVGTRPKHVSRLTRTSRSTSQLEVFAPHLEYFGTTPSSRLKDIDRWATANLKVTSRVQHEIKAKP